MHKILLTDDNEDVLKIVGTSLQEAGYEVIRAKSGADALCLLADKPPPELLILDLGMPGTDGHTVLQYLGPSAPPVILITGELVTAADFLGGRVKRVVLKPFNLTDILTAVTDVLGAPPPGPVEEVSKCP